MQDRIYDEIMALARYHGGPCLSVFLPALPRGSDRPRSARLERLLEAGARQLLASGHDQTMVAATLASLRGQAADQGFGMSPQPALALFAAPDVLRTYRLPYGVAELTVAGRRFYLKPLFPLLSYSTPFYVLALSKNRVRLLRATCDDVEPLELAGAPASLADTLKYDDFAPQHQVHPGKTSRGVGDGAVFYGHGAIADTAKEELRRYCQQVDRAVCEALPHGEALLVLAGVRYLLALYRAASRYPAIATDAVVGSPDRLSDEALRARAWALVRSVLDRRQVAAVAHYDGLAASHPQDATSYLRTIVPAARDGRVEMLLVSGDEQQWGTYDEATGALELHSSAKAGDEDLLDVAAVQTFLHGGDVYVVPAGQMPGGALCAATLRQWTVTRVQGSQPA